MQQNQDADASGAAGQGARVGESVGAAVGAVVDEAAHRAAEAAAAVAEGYGVVRDRVAGTDAGALVRHWTEALEGVVEDGRERAASALAVPTRTPRRWPWSVGAAVAGAAAGAAVALAVRRLAGQDAPDAQEPEHLRAVVDTGLQEPPGPPVA